jgi:hypothetical protein
MNTDAGAMMTDISAYGSGLPSFGVGPDFYHAMESQNINYGRPPLSRTSTAVTALPLYSTNPPTRATSPVGSPRVPENVHLSGLSNIPEEAAFQNSPAQAHQPQYIVPEVKRVSGMKAGLVAFAIVGSIVGTFAGIAGGGVFNDK